MMSWAEFPDAQVKVTKGQLKTFNSSGTAMRSFCGDCGTGIFYTNAELLPGVFEIQSATLDDPNLLSPTMQIQTAERVEWMTHLESITAYERFP